MTCLPAPLLRGLTILALGTTLALSHIAFAAASPQPAQVVSAAAEVMKTVDVESTGSITARQEMAENCYIDMQVVKSVRGKTILTRSHECD